MTVAIDRKEIYGKDSEIYEIVNRLTQLASEGDYVYRGYNKRQECLPGLLRNGASFRNKEIVLLKDFEKYGSHYFQASSTVDFLSSAQHYGLPTRLLDFTHNPFIALSFALNAKKSDEDDDYYHILISDLEQNIVLNTIPYQETLFFMTLRTELLADRARLAIDEIEKLFAGTINDFDSWVKLAIENGIVSDNEIKLKEKIGNKRILFIDPNQANPRIMVQQGVFMLPYTVDEKEHIDILNNNCRDILIHKAHRTELLHYIEALGFGALRLMPDLANVCVAIRNKYSE